MARMIRGRRGVGGRGRVKKRYVHGSIYLFAMCFFISSVMPCSSLGVGISYGWRIDIAVILATILAGWRCQHTGYRLDTRPCKSKVNVGFWFSKREKCDA